MFGGAYVKCPACGATVWNTLLEQHECAPALLAAQEAEKVEAEFGAYLATEHGRFDVYYAETRR